MSDISECSTCPQCKKNCLTDYNYVNIKCANHTFNTGFHVYFSCEICKSCSSCYDECFECNKCTYCVSENNIHLEDVKYQANFREIFPMCLEDDNTSYCQICFEQSVEKIPKYQTVVKLYLEILLENWISRDVMNIICKYYFE